MSTDGMNFDTLNAGAGTDAGVDASAANASKNKDKKEHSAKIITTFVTKLQENPGLKEIVNSKSEDVRVVNTLAYGETGGLIQTQPEVKDENGIVTQARKVQQTSMIVGYLIENVGKEPITVTTEVYKLDPATNDFVGEVKDVVVNPGKSLALARKYFTMFASRPEYSFKLKNGTVTKGSANPTNVTELLEAHYFDFEGDMTVHDDAIKKNISDRIDEQEIRGKVTGIYKVKKEFAPVFGFLDNKKVSARGAKGSTKQGSEIKLAAAANFIQELVQKSSKGLL
jgi:hypothetical protein